MSVRAPTKADIRRSLEEQLAQNGGNVGHFRDMLNDYMTFYDTKKQLQADIKKRGVSYPTTSASGYPIVKQNQSVKDLIQVNKQMLLILEKLNLTTANAQVHVDDGEEL